MKTLHLFKIGGNVIDNPSLLGKFLKDFSAIQGDKLVVHGGGKLLTDLAKKLSIPQTMLEGRRVTDAPTLDLACMVYAGLINKKVVAKLQSLNCNAMGLTGADGNVITSQKRQDDVIDFGFVGAVSTKGINVSLIQHLLDMGITPVLNSITHDGLGELFNTNADTIVTQLAIALSPYYDVKLTYCFEKNGVLSDVEDENSVLEQIRHTEYIKLKTEKIIYEGMIPKLDNAFDAVKQGVKAVNICHAENIFKQGTLITN